MTMLETWLYSMAVYNFWSYSSTIPYVKAITSAITWPLSYHYWLFLTIRKHFQTSQPLLTTSIHLCPFWAIICYFWPFLATCDPFQPLLMTISYHSRLFLTSIKHFQPIPNTSSHFWPYSTTFGYFLPFFAIFGHFWPPVTIFRLFQAMYVPQSHFLGQWWLH